MRSLLALALAAGLAGCGAAGAVQLDAGDSGRTISLDEGAELTVRLEANPSTGFAWRTAERPDAAILRLVSSRYQPPEDGDAVGRPGTSVWRFEAVGAGETSLRLEYVRPFAPDEPDGEFALTVRVD